MNGALKPPSALNLTDLSVSDINLCGEAFNDFLLLTQEKRDDDFLRGLFLAVGGLELRKLVHGLNLLDKKFQMVRKFHNLLFAFVSKLLFAILIKLITILL